MMRKSLWMLSTVGILGLAVAVSVADDQVEFGRSLTATQPRPATRRPRMQYFSPNSPAPVATSASDTPATSAAKPVSPAAAAPASSGSGNLSVRRIPTKSQRMPIGPQPQANSTQERPIAAVLNVEAIPDGSSPARETVADSAPSAASSASFPLKSMPVPSNAPAATAAGNGSFRPASMSRLTAPSSARFQQDEFFRPAAGTTQTAESLTHADYSATQESHDTRAIQQVDGENPFDGFEIMVDEPESTRPAAPSANPFEAREAPVLTAPQGDNPFDAREPARRFVPSDDGFATPAQRSPDSSVSAATAMPAALPTTTAVDAIANGPQTPAVTLAWENVGSVNVGQPCDCELAVRNTSQAVAGNVIVEASFPASVRLLSADPQPQQTADHLAWSLGELSPGQAQTIRIRMVPNQRGPIQTAAYVRFSGRSTASFNVEEPMLEVALQGSDRVVIGEPAPHVIRVSNPGSGIARNVSVQTLIPEGLEHRRGSRLVMDIGPLNPGESRDVRLALTAVAGGRHQLIVRATAEGELNAETNTVVNVMAPQLKVALNGPANRFVGRAADYAMLVTNEGPAASTNVRAKYRVPDGFDFVKANRGGKFSGEENTIDWFLGSLGPGETTELKLTLTAVETGSFTHQGGVISEHGGATTATMETAIEGAANLTMQIANSGGNLRVGSETVFELRVGNDGSSDAKNVGLSIEMPSGLEVVGARGPSEYIAENGVVVFKSLESLQPGRSAVYEVQVRGVRDGSHRIRARLASESITEPVITEKVTRFSAE